MSKELTQRLLISIIGIPFLLYVFYSGRLLLFIFMGVISIIGAWEYNKILTRTSSIVRILDMLITILIYILVANPFIITSVANKVALLTVTICLRLIIGSYNKGIQLLAKDYLLTIIGWIYTGFFPGLIFILGNGNLNLNVLLFLVVLIWITDSVAYFVGIKFGKHRGIFPVSPNKSLEGFVAGIVAPILISGIVILGFKYIAGETLLLSAICAGIFGQIGDLFESKIKRLGGVKDSGSLIPGHGGILDRFDSLLLAGPVLYFLLKLFP